MQNFMQVRNQYKSKVKVAKIKSFLSKFINWYQKSEKEKGRAKIPIMIDSQNKVKNIPIIELKIDVFLSDVCLKIKD